MISIPATTANLGPGFDSFGMALSLYNLFDATPAPTDAFAFSSHSSVPAMGADGRLFFNALDRFYQTLGQPRPRLNVTVTAHIPLARGLGSSSSVIAGALRLGTELSGQVMSEAALVALATEIEGHPDNVAPALLGGVQLCDGPKTYALPWPEAWGVLVLVPDYPLETAKARAALPPHVTYSQAITNVRKASLLTYALLKADADALADALEDALHQPYRQGLIAEWPMVQAWAKASGAFGCVISGAGPSLAVFYPKATPPTVPADWALKPYWLEVV
jgi:homoserine kinase